MNKNITINISLPTSLYKDSLKFVEQRGYTSFSEFVRDALRRKMLLTDDEIDSISKNRVKFDKKN